MPIEETVSGCHRSWSLLKKLGEGDAGEVFLVESILDKKSAILKRPLRSAFTSDILRQATQIENEGKVLQALAEQTLSNAATHLAVPTLLDQAQPGSEYSERYYIIIQKASGFDLASLARISRFGLEPQDMLSQVDQFFLEELTRQGALPDLLILRAFMATLTLFDRIHTAPLRKDQVTQAGVIWNDVKPDHIFWDPERASFIFIDWGNSQFLEEDGSTKDRRFSRKDDYGQFFHTFGNFLSDYAPRLYSRLNWAEVTKTGTSFQENLRLLKEHLMQLLQEAQLELRAIRQNEYDLLQFAIPDLTIFNQLVNCQTSICALGEQPDYSGFHRFSLELAHQLASTNQLESFQEICNSIHHLPFCSIDKWQLLTQIATLGRENPNQSMKFCQVLIAGLNDDWATALWELMLTTHESQTEPEWWASVSERLRRMQPEVDPQSSTPLITLKRLIHTLLAEARRDPSNDRSTQFPVACEKLAKKLREEIVYKWDQIEPDPPNAGLAYDDIDELLDEIGELLPEARLAMLRAINQPRAQVQLVLSAWERRDFDTALLGLRRVLFWDPERRRVLIAESVILAAPRWLEKIQSGPSNGQSLPDFVIEVEWRGREFRNHIGPASWLDLYLELFQQLRKGSWPADLLLLHPELRSEMPWLIEYEPGQQSVFEIARPVRLEREISNTSPAMVIQGILPGVLGQDQDFFLTEPLDTWAPEARGSSARVFNGFLRNPAGNLQQCAIKLMRPQQADYALPLFREEIQVLMLMQDVPGVNPMLEYGFLKLDPEQSIPAEQPSATARFLTGTLQRYGPDQVLTYLGSLEERIEQGWIPYLALEKRNRDDNLMQLCDSGHTRGRFLPLGEGLRLGIQILDILQIAHARNIIYRDHKILHYYWVELYNGVFMIDWNIAKRYPQGLSPAECQFDLVQFGARALHHILTGRPAPGSLPLGPNRPEEIEAAAHSYRPQWTYDDQRLPQTIRDILERVLTGGYTEAQNIRQDLYQIYQQILIANQAQATNAILNLDNIL